MYAQTLRRKPVAKLGAIDWSGIFTSATEAITKVAPMIINRNLDKAVTKSNAKIAIAEANAKLEIARLQAQQGFYNPLAMQGGVGSGYAPSPIGNMYTTGDSGISQYMPYILIGGGVLAVALLMKKGK